MRTTRDHEVGFLMLFGVLGCGRVEPASSGIPISSAPVEIAQSVCPKAYSCCTASQLMGNQMAGTDEPSCETQTADAFQKQLSAVETSQEDGRSRYDGDQLDACLAYVRASTCEMLGVTNHLAGLPGCANFVQPLVSDGGACVYDWECIGGRCQAAICAPLPAAGEACPDGTCAAGAACDQTGGTCVAVGADGDPCTQAIQCPSGMCTGGTCAPAASACFYSSGCSVAGRGGAGWVALALGGAWLMALRRGGRSWRRRSRPAR